jgi:hypothetical protein
MEALSSRLGLVAEAAELLMGESSLVKDSHWRIFLRYCTNQNLNPGALTEGNDGGFAPAYTMAIVSTIVSTYELALGEALRSVALGQLSKQLKKRKSRFPNMDITEFPMDYESCFLQPLVLALFPLSATEPVSFRVTALKMAHLRLLMLGMVRFYAPLRSSDVAHMWRPSCKFFSEAGVKKFSFRSRRTTSRPLSPFLACVARKRRIRRIGFVWCVWRRSTWIVPLRRRFANTSMWASAIVARGFLVMMGHSCSWRFPDRKGSTMRSHRIGSEV